MEARCNEKDSTTWDTDIRGYEILDVTDDGVIGVWNGNNAARPILAGDYVIAINSDQAALVFHLPVPVMKLAQSHRLFIDACAEI